MTTNHFELRLKTHTEAARVAFGQPEYQELWPIPQIWIDDVQLDEPHPVSVNAVLQSISKAGLHTWSRDWHFVFTCGCGEPACADIDEGVGAIQHDAAVEWVFRRPQANKFGSDVLGFKKWCETATWHQYRFDRHQATAELIRFLDEVWEVIVTTEFVMPSKSSVLDWFRDDPRPFMRYRSIEQWSPPTVASEP